MRFLSSPSILVGAVPSHHGALSLRRNFSWNLVGNIVYAACQWGVVVVLAKLTSPEMVGRFALGLAVTAPIIMLTDLQLRGVQATDAREEYLFGHYLGLRLMTTLLSIIIIAAVAFGGKYPLHVSLMIIVVGFSKAFESISDTFYGFMQHHERMDRIAKSRMVKGPLSLFVMGAVVYMTGDVLFGAIGLTLSWALIMILYDIPSAKSVMKCITGHKNPNILNVTSRNLLPNFDWRQLSRLAKLSMPLGIVMGLLSLQPNIPRYFIERYWGEATLGIFAALAYLIVAGGTVTGAIGQSATPKMANYYATGDYLNFFRLLSRLVIIGILMGVAGVSIAFLCGRPLLVLLYGEQYAAYVNVFIWLMFSGAAGFVSSFMGYGITAAQYFRIQVPLNIIVVGITAISAQLLIPANGSLGAAMALTVGASAKVVGSLSVILVIKNKAGSRTPDRPALAR